MKIISAVLIKVYLLLLILDMNIVTSSKEGSTKSENTSTKSPIATKSSEPHWEQWTSWSSCSVTCGKGRNIRWRHCKENCKEAETEMEERSCQMPACPQKLFGLIKL